MSFFIAGLCATVIAMGVGGVMLALTSNPYTAVGAACTVAFMLGTIAEERGWTK